MDSLHTPTLKLHYAICLTYVDRSKEILINSGHNPDFHKEIGIGWWEDSPNIIKICYCKTL